jgi:hypothetical protein
MYKLIIILLVFNLNFSFAQTEIEDYKIYSLVLNNEIEIFENWSKKSIDTIVLIKHFKDKKKQDFSYVYELSKDSIPLGALNWYVKNDSIKQKFITEKNLKEVVSKISSDFNNHPKINVNLLKLKSNTIDLISSREYYQIFKKDKSWDEVIDKYGTRYFFQLSVIKYYNNYATLYVSKTCSRLCGGGSIVFFEKINGKWTHLTEINLWMS